MDSGSISTFAALAGAAIGGLTSFATSWVTQQAAQDERSGKAFRGEARVSQLFPATVLQALRKRSWR
jgi:hypothetical protein